MNIHENQGEGATQRTVADEAERAVAIAAALTYIDQARHLLDGRHEACQICRSEMDSRVVIDEGIPHTELFVVHQSDCPLRDLQRAWERLNWIFENDA